MAEKGKVVYYDLNEDASEYLDSCDFEDLGHLNYRGAKKVSNYFANILNSNHIKSHL